MFKMLQEACGLEVTAAILFSDDRHFKEGEHKGH
jgi:hypothetical protein